MFTQKEIDLFWTKVDKTDTCWNWTAYKDKGGYGSLTVKRTPYLAHRFTKLILGEDPTGYVVMHTCDNPGCVRPEHLKLGSLIENNLDRDNKNRQAKGINNGNSKLTEQQVLEIRNMPFGKRGDNKRIQLKYNISGWQVRDIINKKVWKHI